jgi:LPS sulfotransferase NodH
MPRSYLICASARTGSNLLATALRDMGIGRPYEYFNEGQFSDPFMLKLLGLPDDSIDLPDRLDRIVSAATTANGVFGATVHWLDLQRLLEAVAKKQERILPLDGHSADGVRSLFPPLSYIWLHRENRVAQGVSHYLAIETGRWFEQVGDPERDRSQDREIPFDFQIITKKVRLATREEAAWRQFLSNSLDTTLELTYEELAADFAGTVARVLAFLDMPAGLKIPPPGLRRQGDDRSVEWERRYREQAQAEASDPTKPVRPLVATVGALKPGQSPTGSSPTRG